jgi:hypothetical protein
MTKIPLNQQISAMELEIVNTRGHLENIRKLASQKKYDHTMVQLVEEHLPRLEAVLKSLEFLEKNQEKIKELFANKSK